MLMSCEVRRGSTATSEQAAHLCGVRPGPEAARPRGADGRPDLLERRPVVGRALEEEEPRRVRTLEAEIHLEAAVVRAAAVRPAPFVVVDAEPGREMRRV